MSPRRTAFLLLVLALSSALCGCFGGGGGGSSRSKKSASAKKGRGKGKNGNVAHENIDDLSPEGSMGRDLKRLQDMEQAQIKKINAMRGDLDKGEGMIQREEQALADIRQKIRHYDTAMQRYEMASRARPPRDDFGESALVPASQFADRPVRGARPVSAQAGQGARNYETPLYAYDEPRRPSRSSGRVRQQPVMNEGETLIYAPDMNEPMYSAMAAPAPAYGRQEANAYGAPYGQAPYAQAPAGPAEYGRPGRQQPPAYDGYADDRYDDAYAPRPAQPQPRQAVRQAPVRPDYDQMVLAEGANGQWDAPRNLFSNTARGSTQFPDPDMIRANRSGRGDPPADTRAKAPANPAGNSVRPAAQAAPAPAAGQGSEEEVFMPDMFLGR